MDRKSRKKIGKYIGIYLIFGCIFTIEMYLLADYMVTVKHQQMLTLLIEYPEMEAEIISLWEKPLGSRLLDNADAKQIEAATRMIEEKYGYEFRGAVAENIVWKIWGVGLILGAVGTGVLWYISSRKEGKRSGTREEVQELYEYLENFRAGEFHAVPEIAETSDEWMKVWETVRELGVYFEGLKMQLAEEEDRTKALITDISHQLKTPLASLRMSHELVAGENLTDDERREFQEQETKEIEKLSMLLDELVNLSRLEMHMIQIHPVPGSLRRTITEAVTQIYVKARSKNIEIEVDMDGDIQICHDEKWTVEAIENVLDNAVKYSEENTIVKIRVSKLIRNVLIEIEDEGMGLEDEELHKIYHRFYRGSEAQKKVKEGAGVGLYLSRKILEQQGGTISARRKSDQGTIFKITLPC